jgi:hypothetical protein
MTITIQNAIIASAILTTNERDMLDMWLHLDYGGMSQGFGGWALYLSKTYRNHSLESAAGHHIYRCMEIAGVDNFNKLQGRSIRVESTGGRITGIGHIIKDDWYRPEEDFKLMKTGKMS